MSIGSITFGGITEVKNEIVYNGVRCLYVNRGVDYFVQPINPTESINQFAGTGKAVSKEELNNLINVKTTKQ